MLVGVSGKPDLEGGAMEAIETLKREHRIVDQVCEACRRELDRADDTGVLDPIEMERFVEFFRFYANACHDPKEEDLLFTMLHHRGLSWEEDPLADLVREHEEMRVILDAASGWVPHLKDGESSAMRPLSRDMRSYTELVLAHIRKEEEGIFVHALDTLTEADHDELTLAFENVACDEGDEGIHAYYSELAHELAAYTA
jgi:hemerythrin-like domain-containing protein